VVLQKHLSTIVAFQQVIWRNYNIVPVFLNSFCIYEFFFQTLSDPRFKKIMEEIQKVIHDDTRYQKGTMNMRTQKCFAIKVAE
jgi:hypothetical protein